MVWVEINKKTDDLEARQCMARYVCDASKRKEKQKWAIEKPKHENARRLRGIFFIDPDDDEIKRIMQNARRKFEIRCQLQCLANFNVISTGRLVAQLDNTRRNMLVFLRPTDL